MSERAQPYREWLDWLAVVLWSMVIFATIPLARTIQGAVENAWSEDAFLYAVLFVILGAVAVAFRYVRGLEGISRGRIAWLVAVGSVYVAYVFSLRGDPVEAVHFVEYGVLGILAFRALAHRMHDTGIYLVAAAVGGIVGTLDEAIQWATPRRVWDVRDIWFNFFGASLVQLAIAAGIRPARISGPPSAASVRRICGAGLIAVSLLGASFLNTPARIAWYAARVPGLGFLLESSDVMLEYGHLYEVPEIGRFRSRFPPAELARRDAERGAEAGPILGRSSEDDYKLFLDEYTPITDPFLHEARVHLFRRDRYLTTAEWHLDDETWYRQDLTVGYRENLILEQYFSNTLRHSGRALPAERVRELAEKHFPEQPYESRVSEDLLTRIGERHIVAGWLAALVLLLATSHLAGRRRDA